MEKGTDEKLEDLMQNRDSSYLDFINTLGINTEKVGKIITLGLVSRVGLMIRTAKKVQGNYPEEKPRDLL